MRIPDLLTRHGLTVLALMFVLQITAAISLGCDTPVYRYAMYRWLPAPYEVYFFHEGEMGEAGQQLQAAIEKAAESVEAPVNIVLLPVNLSKDKDLTGVPPDVKEAWQKLKNPTLPAVLMSSPVGVQLPIDSLTPEDLPAIIDSPLRRQVGELLEAGKAGVYILLEGKDAAANAAAEKELRGVVDDVAGGKVALYNLAPAQGGFGDPDASDSQDSQTEQSQLTVGLLTLARDDAKEKWLVNCLLGLEPDLRDSKEPVVFMVYGRGRVLFSCLGKGIHRDNLLQDVEFITGACSCTVKEQNPGVDLLMSYNWDAAAESLAERYGSEEGSSYDFSGDALFPELIIPPTSEMAGAGTDDSAAEPSGDAVVAQADTTTSAETADTTVTNADSSATSTSETNSKDAQDGSASKDQSGTDTKIATATPQTQGADGDGDQQTQSPASSFRGVVWVGAGLFGALVVLFGATFLVMRPK